MKLELRRSVYNIHYSILKAAFVIIGPSNWLFYRLPIVKLVATFIVINTTKIELWKYHQIAPRKG